MVDLATNSEWDVQFEDQTTVHARQSTGKLDQVDNPSVYLDFY